MSRPGPPTDPPGLTRVELPARRGAGALAVLLGALGAGEVGAVYVAVRRRLPSQIVDHFALTGRPNGSMGPEVFLAISLAEIVAISAVFVGLQVWVVRSASLTLHFRGRLPTALLWLQGGIVALVLPLIAALLLTSAAGVLPLTGASLGWVLNALGFSTAGLVLVLALLQGRRQLPETPLTRSTVAMYPARFAVGGPIELSCPACGERYRLPGVPLFAPHMGFGQFGSLYLRCPRCGERGWNPIVARLARRSPPGPPAPGGP